MTEEQKEIVKLAKGGSWYDEWKPYCLICTTNERMIEMSDGFMCTHCRARTNWDLTRHPQSTSPKPK
jgi:hypothetical protein